MTDKQDRKSYVNGIFEHYEEIRKFNNLMHSEQVQHVLESETVKPSNLQLAKDSTVLMDKPYMAVVRIGL